MNSKWYLVFRIEKHFYAFSIKQIREVVPMATLTPLPGAFSFWEGLLNLRGRHIPIFNLRAKLGLTAKPVQFKNAILIVAGEKGEKAAGIMVDEIITVANPSKVEKDVPSPSTLAKEILTLTDGSTALALSLEEMLGEEVLWNTYHL